MSPKIELPLNNNLLKKYKNQFSIVTISGIYKESLSKIPNGLQVKSYNDLNTIEKKDFHKSFNYQDDSNKDIFTSINTINCNETLIIKIDKNYSSKEHINIKLFRYFF